MDLPQTPWIRFRYFLGSIRHETNFLRATLSVPLSWESSFHYPSDTPPSGPFLTALAAAILRKSALLLVLGYSESSFQ
jgi:hypothetical protein